MRGHISKTKSHKKGGGGISYTAEVQYLGRRYRKSSISYEVCKIWLDDMRKKIDNDVEKEGINLPSTSSSNRGRKNLYNYKIKSLNDSYGIVTYILQEPSINIFKIGKSRNILGRIKSICLPSIKLVAWREGDIEVEVHDALSEKKKVGEWYMLNESDMKILKDRYGFKEFNI